MTRRPMRYCGYVLTAAAPGARNSPFCVTLAIIGNLPSAYRTEHRIPDIPWLTISDDRLAHGLVALTSRDRVDLNEELGPGQARHADERVGGLVVPE